MGNIESILAELAAKNFIAAGGKRGVKTGNSRKIKRKDNTQNSKFSISTILINSALKEIKWESKGKDNTSEEDFEEDTEGKIIEDERKIIVSGGYGTIKPYAGMSPHIKYTDYDKIWSHLGTFRANSMYENIESSSNDIALKNGESTREMVSKETIEKAARHFKYFISGDVISDIGYVPPVGSNIDSREWEKYRLMTKMSIYLPLLKLKWITA